MLSLEIPIENASRSPRRMTSTEEVFLQLKTDIMSLRLAPGSKISEAEVAKAHDVSRQPVREAFLRLSGLNLLHITPQKATRIRKISLDELHNTRFLRAAVEVEVVRVACQIATPDTLAPLAENLVQQKLAVKTRDAKALQILDYHFHRLICFAANRLPAFQTIAENKAHTDRVCTLELSDTSGMEEVIEGHTAIYDAIKQRDEDVAVAMTRHHLCHLDGTLARACDRHPEFFAD